MPQPEPGENRGQFNARCMADPEALRDFPDEGQRFAFCNSTFEQGQTRATKAKARMAEAGAPPAEDRVLLEVQGDEAGHMRAMLEHIGKTAAIGHSFNVVVDPGDAEHERTFSFDGDGAFRAGLKEEATPAPAPPAAEPSKGPQIASEPPRAPLGWRLGPAPPPPLEGDTLAEAARAARLGGNWPAPSGRVE